MFVELDPSGLDGEKGVERTVERWEGGVIWGIVCFCFRLRFQFRVRFRGRFGRRVLRTRDGRVRECEGDEVVGITAEGRTDLVERCG